MMMIVIIFVINYTCRKAHSNIIVACEVSCTEEAKLAKEALLTVRKVLDDKDTSDDVTLDELLVKAGVSACKA